MAGFGFTGTYVDCNAIAPATAAQISGATTAKLCGECGEDARLTNAFWLSPHQRSSRPVAARLVAATLSTVGLSGDRPNPQARVARALGSTFPERARR